MTAKGIAPCGIELSSISRSSLSHSFLAAVAAWTAAAIHPTTWVVPDARACAALQHREFFRLQVTAEVAAREADVPAVAALDLPTVAETNMLRAPAFLAAAYADVDAVDAVGVVDRKSSSTTTGSHATVRSWDWRLF